MHHLEALARELGIDPDYATQTSEDDSEARGDLQDAIAGALRERAAALTPDTPALERARHNLLNGRAAINQLMENIHDAAMKALEPNPVAKEQLGDQAGPDDPQAVLIFSMLRDTIAALYGPLSAIGYALVAQAEPAPAAAAPASTPADVLERVVNASWHATQSAGCNTAVGDEVAAAVRAAFAPTGERQ